LSKIVVFEELTNSKMAFFDLFNRVKVFTSIRLPFTTLVVKACA